MKPEKSRSIERDPWENLKKFTNARIALGSTGSSIPLEEVLKFRFAHAKAKDAIYSGLKNEFLKSQIQAWNYPVWEVKSRVNDRDEYLKRPDLGRKLNNSSEELLKEAHETFDIVFVIADGLSANAVNKNTIPLLKEILPKWKGRKIGFVLATMARVALSDVIGTLLNTKIVVMCIGERPGLSSPESMGVYTTYAPKLGLTDERRNCISNIHENGLEGKQAASLLHHLVQQSFAKKTSGINIKMDVQDLLED